MAAKLGFIILIALLVGALWQWHETHLALEKAEERLVRMDTHAQSLEKRVFELEQELASAHEATLEGVAEEASEIFIEGWETALDEFKKRLEDAKDAMLGPRLTPSPGTPDLNSNEEAL